MSLERAEKNVVSFIQGPPGTGKTYNASVIVLSLSTLEKGKIIVCAPSNEASNGIAEAMRKLNGYFNLKRKLLRVFARSRELHSELRDGKVLRILHGMTECSETLK
jgi:DNA replication protein DnaC